MHSTQFLVLIFSSVALVSSLSLSLGTASPVVLPNLQISSSCASVCQPQTNFLSDCGTQALCLCDQAVRTALESCMACLSTPSTADHDAITAFNTQYTNGCISNGFRQGTPAKPSPSPSVTSTAPTPTSSAVVLAKNGSSSVTDDLKTFATLFASLLLGSYLVV